ncbi:MAG: tetratricopeptide repeat protein [Thiotrichales bacterium]
MSSIKPLLFALFACLPLNLMGQKLEPSQNVLSYDWFIHDSPAIKISAIDTIDLYSERYEGDPGNPVALNNLGIAYAINGDYASALFLLVRAVTLDPKNRLLHENLTSLRARTKVVWQHYPTAHIGTQPVRAEHAELTPEIARPHDPRIFF